ncbi:MULTISPECIES: DUF805 domain-containing protein [unclassified Staphylococcus]|uniref:DUF805 domain-containing protein n=1 Tax=unclassified Staphylococcus TaxID=91994 RepID=UPI0021D0B3B0|nr:MULTISPECIES: DUF805 domain-containing protein [unclassified Staphylococcus]UXR71401.1 DUF805 domain-containing protein [Staphylococcus sp. IVB6240]UXR75997.1 DUF805 domain-containing protein [Staphylococcus sp. IVB6233]UXR80194.1 DUF805 domain-containing protein [Staphylococcus sp. IVB6218]
MYEYPQVGFVEAFKLFWTNYVNFKGRSRRSEYWWMQLWHVLITVSASVIAVITLFVPVVGPIISVILWLLIAVYSLAVIIPNLALLVRRFHDRSKTMFLPIFSFVLSIIYNTVYFIALFDSGDLLSDKPLDESASMFSADSSPWFIVAGVIMIVIAIVQLIIFIFTLLDSKEETNQYGPSPKYTEQPNQQHVPQTQVKSETSVTEESKALSDLDDLEEQYRKKQDDPYKY